MSTLQGLPIAFVLTGAKADERETLLDLLAAECELLRERRGQTLIGAKNYFGRGFERELSERGVQLLRPARRGERERPGAALFKPLRQDATTSSRVYDFFRYVAYGGPALLIGVALFTLVCWPAGAGLRPRRRLQLVRPTAPARPPARRLPPPATGAACAGRSPPRPSLVSWSGDHHAAQPEPSPAAPPSRAPPRPPQPRNPRRGW
ncbi:hypothetical protein [Streptomyces sp. NBC_01373]|uniref:hypothetical protein n=1 Tax=Streptomyces sp. NBC_01373 TaxID=2903843 RepID=UPI00225B9D7D|nr:hypothetical protein [Streptomyces sp. NBC_01373]MCX4706845.1 hypothetical protein [Streptomyces sp. NBC_01373]